MDCSRGSRAGLGRFDCEPLRTPPGATATAASGCAVLGGYLLRSKGESAKMRAADSEHEG